MRAPDFVTSAHMQRNFGAVLLSVMTGPHMLILTSHERPVAALISMAEYDEYCRLRRERIIRGEDETDE